MNNEETIKDHNAQELEPKVTGIGGVFFRSNDPDETKKWYTEHLGFETNAYGATFEGRELDNPEVINALQWSVFKSDTAYFEPSTKEFMINYRVQNIEGLVAKMLKNGATVLDEIVTYEYGKFVHLLDPDGNKTTLGTHWNASKGIKLRKNHGENNNRELPRQPLHPPKQLVTGSCIGCKRRNYFHLKSCHWRCHRKQFKGSHGTGNGCRIGRRSIIHGSR